MMVGEMSEGTRALVHTVRMSEDNDTPEYSFFFLAGKTEECE